MMVVGLVVVVEVVMVTATGVVTVAAAGRSSSVMMVVGDWRVVTTRTIMTIEDSRLVSGKFNIELTY